jgi:hypothetical protein
MLMREYERTGQEPDWFFVSARRYPPPLRLVLAGPLASGAVASARRVAVPSLRMVSFQSRTIW